MIEIIDRDSLPRTFEEYVEWRRTGIGGSVAPVIKRESPFQTPLLAWARKNRFVPPEPDNFRMQRGRKLEPIARAKYEAKFGIPMPSKIMMHPDLRYMRGSLDGLNLDARGGIEIKAPCAADHIEALNGNVPAKYISQCTHYLFVCGMEWIDYVSFNPDFDGPELARVRVTRNNRLERELLAAEKEFYQFMVTGTPPPHDPKLELPWPWPKYALEWKRFLKGEPMTTKNITPNPGIAPLTKADIVELAKQLKAIGLRRFELAELTLDYGGHAAALEPAPAAVTAAQQPVVMDPPASEPRPLCEIHRTVMNPSRFPNGPKFYCYDCNQAKKRQVH
jgi:putative phage-type endonuclease